MDRLREGKAEQTVLHNSVLNRISQVRPEIPLRTDEACDGAVIPTGSLTVVSTGVVTEDIDDKCFYAFYRAVNNAAAAQAEPAALFTSVIMPEGTGRDHLKACTDRFCALGAAENVQICGGHSEVSGAVNSTVISAVCVGRSLSGQSGVRPEPKNGLSVIMTKYAGLEGTAILAREKEGDLRKYFPGYFVDEAAKLKAFVPAVADASAVSGRSDVIIHDASKGGVLSALWDIAAAYECGLEIDMRSIPVRQETVEICEFFNINPYELLSGGSMIILTGDGSFVTDSLKKAGIPSRIIGCTTGGKNKLLINGEMTGCMNRPSRDALLSVL